MNPPSGRELDALIAEKVMGFKYWGSQCWGPDRKHITELSYSTSITAAWEVVERLSAPLAICLAALKAVGELK